MVEERPVLERQQLPSPDLDVIPAADGDGHAAGVWVVPEERAPALPEVLRQPLARAAQERRCPRRSWRAPAPPAYCLQGRARTMPSTEVIPAAGTTSEDVRQVWGIGASR
jgi:hypothetical protein